LKNNRNRTLPEWKKLYVDKTRNTGKGLFAKSNFNKGDIIFVWKGKKLESHYPHSLWPVDHRALQIEKYEWISPFKNNPGWYINHSCNPNTGIKGSVKIVAMKEIRRGEEVTIDYSMFESEKRWKLECRCGNKNCRRVISSYQYLPEQLKRKYRNFISDYLKHS
jgi:SET domain-containing protein